MNGQVVPPWLPSSRILQPSAPHQAPDTIQISDLSDDTWRLVLQCVSLADLKGCNRTCRRLWHLSNEDTVWIRHAQEWLDMEADKWEQPHVDAAALQRAFNIPAARSLMLGLRELGCSPVGLWWADPRDPRYPRGMRMLLITAADPASESAAAATAVSWKTLDKQFQPIPQHDGIQGRPLPHLQAYATNCEISNTTAESTAVGSSGTAAPLLPFFTLHFNSCKRPCVRGTHVRGLDTVGGCNGSSSTSGSGSSCDDMSIVGSGDGGTIGVGGLSGGSCNEGKSVVGGGGSNAAEFKVRGRGGNGIGLVGGDVHSLAIAAGTATATDTARGATAATAAPCDDAAATYDCDTSPATPTARVANAGQGYADAATDNAGSSAAACTVDTKALGCSTSVDAKPVISIGLKMGFIGYKGWRVQLRHKHTKFQTTQSQLGGRNQELLCGERPATNSSISTSLDPRVMAQLWWIMSETGLTTAHGSPSFSDVLQSCMISCRCTFDETGNRMVVHMAVQEHSEQGEVPVPHLYPLSFPYHRALGGFGHRPVGLPPLPALSLSAATVQQAMGRFVGLWTAMYGPHSHEVVQVQLPKDNPQDCCLLQGLKLQGDPNVPSGKLTFRAFMPGTTIAEGVQLKTGEQDLRGVVVYSSLHAAPSVIVLSSRPIAYRCPGVGQINKLCSRWEPQWEPLELLLYRCEDGSVDTNRFSIVWFDEGRGIRHAQDFSPFPPNQPFRASWLPQQNA